MKIIATTHSGYSPRFLVDIGENELKCCMGDRYAKVEFKIGDVVDVVSARERIQALNGAQDKLVAAKVTLKGILELLEPINPLQTIDSQPKAETP